MTSGSGGQEEPTFADVLNGFSLDGRPRVRLRTLFKRGTGEDEVPGDPAGEAGPDGALTAAAADAGPIPDAVGAQPTEREALEDPTSAVTGAPGDGASTEGGPSPDAVVAEGFDAGAPEDPAGSVRPTPEPGTAVDESADAAASVRPYTWTGGRTRSDYDLAIEALVSTSELGGQTDTLARSEHRAVAELCREPRSVAEVAALLALPLGVARVVLGDMAGLGLVVVHQTAGSLGEIPDLALMERVLSGLRRL